MQFTTLTCALVFASSMVLVQPAAALNSSEFVKKAGAAGMFEVQSSELAKDKADAAALKSLADRMIIDHTRIAKELASMVKNGEVDGVNSVPQALDADHAQTLQKLRTAGEGAFDRAYYDMQLAGHKEAVQLFTEEASTGTDPNLRQWAKATLPTLKEHLALIEQIKRPDGRSS
jgi:putative membrane protein